MKQLHRIALVVSLLLSGAAFAEEGLWLFNSIPDHVRKEIQDTYHFTLTPEFLDHLRIGSVHFGGGSGSFVSPNGLLFTNHHVASGCIQNLSSKEHDYMKDGFFASTQAEEQKCPGMRVRVLLEIRDVTKEVQGAAASTADTVEGNKLRKAAMAGMEDSCTTAGFDCQVVTLYSGGKYNLYRYKEYNDVRLVLAPENAIAAFGGDPDNFNFPRFCLDFTFLRAYENDAPAKPEGYLKWSQRGARVGQLQFVSGHPGTTGRLNAMSQLEFSRDVSYPQMLERLHSLIEVAKTYSQRGAEQKRIAADTLFGLQNSQKAYTGFQGGLEDPALMETKRQEENALRAAVAKNGDLERKYGKLWGELAEAMDAYRKIYTQALLKETSMGRGSDLYMLAKRMERYAVEISKPNEDRLSGYNDANLPYQKRRLAGNFPIHKDFETVMLADSIEALAKKLPDDPTVKKLLKGRTPLEVAKAAVEGTKLDDRAYRAKLLDAPEQIRESEDSMFQLVRVLEPDARELVRIYESEVESVAVAAETKIAQARFGVYGEDSYPDATLTLRLSYGPVRGFTDEKIGFVPPFTTMGGVYDRATGVEPYVLPPSWLKAKDKIDTNLPFNYITTADIHGGNSGSPAVDTNGEVVGIVFDGNLPSLPNRFIYQDRTARAVFVSSQVIVESLRKIYGAERLVEELGVGGGH